MGSIRVRKESGQLFFDFRYQGRRCREQTLLDDTPANRRKLQKVLDRIETEIDKGSFDYASYFPNSRQLEKLTTPPSAVAAPQPLQQVMAAAQARSGEGTETPSFADFTDC